MISNHQWKVKQSGYTEKFSSTRNATENAIHEMLHNGLQIWVETLKKLRFYTVEQNQHNLCEQGIQTSIISAAIEVFEPFGTFDKSQGKQLRQQINYGIKNQAKIVLIDMRNVTYMDSSGLKALTLIRKMLGSNGGKLFLTSINEPVQMLLELTSLDGVFEIFTDHNEFQVNIYGNLNQPTKELATIS